MKKFKLVQIFFLYTKMERSRGTSFNQQIDELIYHVYLEVSQDPITSKNQAFKTLWDKITKSYNAKKKMGS